MYEQTFQQMRRSQQFLFGCVAFSLKHHSFSFPMPPSSRLFVRGSATFQHHTPLATAAFTARTVAAQSTAASKSFLFANDGRNSSASFSSETTTTTTTTTAKTYRLDGIGRTGGTGVDVTTDTGHALSTDIPSSMGGRDEAPQPVETLLAAWMGCTQATASFVGRQLLRERGSGHESGGPNRRRRPPRRQEVLLEFDAIEAVRDERGALELPIRQTPSVPSRLQRITGTIRVSLVAAAGGRTTTGKSAGAGAAAAAATAETETETERISFNPEELEVLKEQTEARCPIANMLVESGCAMDVKWTMDEN